MPYTKTVWADEVPATSPVKYKLTDDVGGVLANSAKIEVVTGITPGTALNAANLNHLENGVETAQAAVEAAQADATAALALANSAMRKVVQLQLLDADSDVDTTAIGYFFVPSTMNGMSLVRAEAMVLTAGVTNPTTVQVRNLTKYPSNDALSTPISIASGGTIGTVGVVNASYDDIATNDKIKVYVTGASTVKAKGLFVVLEYQ